MTYPGLVDVELLLKWAGAASTELGFTLVRQIIAAKSATADLDGAYTNIGNLMGFLDAFKAVFGPPARRRPLVFRHARPCAGHPRLCCI